LLCVFHARRHLAGSGFVVAAHGYVYATNVGPRGGRRRSGGVGFHLHVDFGSPVDVVVTITVLDGIEEFVLA